MAGQKPRRGRGTAGATAVGTPQRAAPPRPRVPRHPTPPSGSPPQHMTGGAAAPTPQCQVWREGGGAENRLRSCGHTHMHAHKCVHACLCACVGIGFECPQMRTCSTWGRGVWTNLKRGRPVGPCSTCNPPQTPPTAGRPAPQQLEPVASAGVQWQLLPQPGRGAVAGWVIGEELRAQQPATLVGDVPRDRPAEAGLEEEGGARGISVQVVPGPAPGPAVMRPSVTKV